VTCIHFVSCRRRPASSFVFARDCCRRLVSGDTGEMQGFRPYSSRGSRCWEAHRFLMLTLWSTLRRVCHRTLYFGASGPFSVA